MAPATISRYALVFARKKGEMEKNKSTDPKYNEKKYRFFSDGTPSHPSSARLTSSPKKAMKDIILPSISSPCPLENSGNFRPMTAIPKTKKRNDTCEKRG